MFVSFDNTNYFIKLCLTIGKDKSKDHLILNGLVIMANTEIKELNYKRIDLENLDQELEKHYRLLLYGFYYPKEH